MGLNGNSYWISSVISNSTGVTAVVELAGTPAWQNGTTVNSSSVVTPQTVWLAPSAAASRFCVRIES